MNYNLKKIPKTKLQNIWIVLVFLLFINTIIQAQESSPQGNQESEKERPRYLKKQTGQPERFFLRANVGFGGGVFEEKKVPSDESLRHTGIAGYVSTSLGMMLPKSMKNFSGELGFTSNTDNNTQVGRGKRAIPSFKGAYSVGALTAGLSYYFPNNKHLNYVSAKLRYIFFSEEKLEIEKSTFTGYGLSLSTTKDWQTHEKIRMGVRVYFLYDFLNGKNKLAENVILIRNVTKREHRQLGLAFSVSWDSSHLFK